VQQQSDLMPAIKHAFEAERKTLRAKKFREAFMPTRREFVGVIAGGVGLGVGFLAVARAHAQAPLPGTVDGWPARSVRVISPTGTGGPGQNFRLYADQLKETFGQGFVLENMPGGSGALGCTAVARAAPDGHTLLLASNSHIVLAPLLTSSPVNVRRTSPRSR
jgi:tripartite-type tricarboxylate transporter receptor subunit TctC